VPAVEELSRDDLSAALVAVHERLRMTAEERARTPLPDPQPGSALAELSAAFGLTPFERGVLLLSVLLELHPGVDTEFAALNGSDQRPWPTFGLALAVLPGPDWNALLPTAPLRGARLVRLSPGEVLADRAVLVEERVLHAFMGAHYLDPRVARRLVPLPRPGVLSAGHAAMADRLRSAWGAERVHLWCEVAADGMSIAAAAAGDRMALRLPASAAPADPEEAEEFLALWARECRLQALCLVVDLDDAGDHAAQRAALDVARRAEGPVVSCGVIPRAGEPLTRLRVGDAPFAEQLAQWRGALGDLSPQAGLERLVARFRLGAAALDAAVVSTRAGLRADPGADPVLLLEDAARVQAHPELEDLAQRSVARARLDDLVLPADQRAALRALMAHSRAKAVVDHLWGFTPPGARGGGAAAVFAGPSGTGKTLAAEALATELRLDLFRIDLSAVVSKYIGETEKNLRRVFDAAEAGGAVLLFDEADALFGKRTEVRDSHDRHANIEVSYLLSRMESYGGLAVLTTNHREHLDQAFLRRIPFVVEFPFPDVDLREQIWRRIFPPGVPLDGVDHRALARLSVSGGSIRSIARNAAFLAADAGEPVSMRTLRVAAELESAKLGRPLTPVEVRGWT
jgi:ATPase family associated with various cellular activities (AAA)